VIIGNVVYCHDIGMAEFGNGLGFAPESGAAIRVPTQIGREELEGDFPIKLQILRQIDFTHPAGADLLDDPIMIDKHSRSQACTGFRIIIVFVGRHDNPPRPESIIDIAVWLVII